MAIERKVYGHDTPMEPGDSEGATEDAGETTEIPSSMLEGQTVKPGDVVRLEVVADNSDSGTITVKYAQPSDSGSAIDDAASKFEG